MKRKLRPLADVEVWLGRGLKTLLVILMGLSWATAQPATVGRPQLLPTAAGAGEKVWITGVRQVPERGQISVGGRLTTFRREPASGWLELTVPKDAATGPQLLRLAGARVPGLTLTVLPPEDDRRIVLYADPATARQLPELYQRKLKELAVTCAQRCPAELRRAIEILQTVPWPDWSPLTTDRGIAGPVASGLRLTLPERIRIPSLTATPVQPARSVPFCSRVAGLFSAPDVSQGLTLGLFDLLFGGELQTDPIGGMHPTAASIPFQDKKPRDVLEDVLSLRSGSGEGVTIHVLDTASATDDDFVLRRKPGDPEPMYYDIPVDGRPYHGRVVAEVAQAVAPAARISLHKVCDGDGDCSTLDVVRALCAVAAEARKGGKHVVNLSAGGSYPALGLKLALAEVASLGVPTAAAYGNRDDCVGHALGDQCRHFPADWTQEFRPAAAPDSTMLLSVAGWDINPDLQHFATYNRAVVIPWAQTPLPSVQAPGEFWSGGQPYFGTSFAAPVVSGVLAGWMSCRPGVPPMPLVTAPHQNPLISVLNICP